MKYNKKGVSTLAFIVAVGIGGIVFFITYKNRKHQPQVILIAGTSSAGKSSIIQELKKVMSSVQVVSIDAFDAEGNIKKVLLAECKILGMD